MARNVVFFLSPVVFYAVAVNGCAPNLTTTPEEEPWGGAGGMEASSSSSSSGNGGSPSSSSSSSGSMGSENCLDGIDNDADGDADCADSDCTVGYECVDEPPSGWDPVLLEQGSGVSPGGGACDDGDTPQTHFTGLAGPAECAACTCGALTGTTCDDLRVMCYTTSATCGGNGQEWTQDFNGVGDCDQPASPGISSLSCRIPAPATVNQPGNCAAPSMVDFPNTETWSGWAQSCSINQIGTGCGAGSICVPKSSNKSVCISRSGDEVCPAGWSTVVTAYQGATDTRACTACTCTPSPTCTGGSYQVIDADNCTNAGTDPPVDVNDATCKDASHLLDQFSWSMKYVAAPTPGGTCTAGGGMPTGSVNPSGEMTFCCK